MKTQERPPAVALPESDGLSPKGLAPGGMWWVAWRLQRPMVVALSAAVLAVTIGLIVLRWLYGWEMDGYDRRSEACAAGLLQAPCWPSPVLSSVLMEVISSARTGLIAVPILVGVILGVRTAVLERERGTHRLALTQGVSRARWLVTHAGVAVGPAVVLFLILGEVTRHTSDLPRGWVDNPFDSEVFVTHGAVPAATFLVAFGLSIGLAVFASSALVGMTIALLIAAPVTLMTAHQMAVEAIPVTTVLAPPGPPVILEERQLPPQPVGSQLVELSWLNSVGAKVDINPCFTAWEDTFDDCFADLGVTQQEVRYRDRAKYPALVSGYWAASALVAAVGLMIAVRRIRRVAL